MHGKKLYGTATVGTKGQVVIPHAAREALGIKESDRLYVIGSEKCGVVGLITEDKMTAIVDTLSDDLAMFKNSTTEKGESGASSLNTKK